MIIFPTNFTFDFCHGSCNQNKLKKISNISSQLQKLQSCMHDNKFNIQRFYEKKYDKLLRVFHMF